MRERLTDKLLKGLKSPATGQIECVGQDHAGFWHSRLDGRPQIIHGRHPDQRQVSPYYASSQPMTRSPSRKHARRRSRSSPTPRPVLAQSRGSDARRRAHSELSPLLSCRTMRRTIARAMRCSAGSTSILLTGTTGRLRRSSAQISKS